MHNFSKKFKQLFSWLKVNRSLAILLVLIVSIGLIIPTQNAEAFDWGWLKNAGRATADAFLSTLLAIPLVISIAIATSGSFVLNSVISEAVISECYACTNNPIIAVGWPLIRDIANIVIVVSLIVIGLATALRIKEYQAQKTLVPLLIAAVLVNFSLVIVGIIVDFSNIFMNFFLKGLTGGWDKFLPDSTASPSDMEGVINDHIRLVTTIIYNMSAGFIFLLFSALLIMRHVAIWFLAIFAPLAFASNVFPKTKKFFGQWLNQLIQWSFIGVTAAFFLFLANKLMEGLALVEPTGTDTGFLDSILKYFVVIATMFMGLIASITTSAGGASQVTSFAKKQGMRQVKNVPDYTKRTAGQVTNAARGIGGGIRRLDSSRFGLKIGERYGNSKLGKWTSSNRAARSLQEKTRGADLADTEKYKEKYKGQSANTMMSGLSSSLGTNERQKIAIVEQAIEEGKLDELRKLGLTDSTLISLAKAKARISPEEFKKKWLGQMPMLADNANLGQGLSYSSKEAAGLLSYDEETVGVSNKLTDAQTQLVNIQNRLLKKPGDKKLKKQENDLLQQVKSFSGTISDLSNKKSKYVTRGSENVANLTSEQIKKADLSGYYHDPNEVDADGKPTSKAEEARTTRKAIDLHWSGNQLAAAAKKHGPKFVNAFNTHSQKQDPGRYKTDNPGLHIYLNGTPAAALGFQQVI